MNRAIRLVVGLVPTVTLLVLAGLGERLMVHAGRSGMRLRDWMDCPR